MKTLALFSVAVVSCGLFASAFAENKRAPEVLSEVTLDIDNDGKMDRAVLVERGDSLDLLIYLGVGDEKLEPSREPTFLKKDILRRNQESSLKSEGVRSLIVSTYDGSSNAHDETLTIVHRGGEFLVAGYTYGWETRVSRGACDINFLSG